jgi:hypothetical protein
MRHRDLHDDPPLGEDGAESDEIARTVRQDAMRGAIIGGLAFLAVVLVTSLVIFWL